MSAAARDLDTVLADWRERANVLRSCKRAPDAELVDTIVQEVADAAREFTTWLSEDDARMRSGWSVKRLRGMWATWQALGHARLGPKGREYRACVVPQRTHTSAAREAGREAARAAARETRRVEAGVRAARRGGAR